MLNRSANGGSENRVETPRGGKSSKKKEKEEEVEVEKRK